MKTNINKKLIAIGLSSGLLLGSLIILPGNVRADFSLCLFDCGKEKETIVNTVTNTNINSNVNSPGSTVNAQGSTVNFSQAAAPSSMMISDTYGYNRPQPTYAPAPTPSVVINNINNDYSYGYRDTYKSYSSYPSYSSQHTYTSYYQQPAKYVQKPVYVQTPVYVQPIVQAPVVYSVPTVIAYDDGYGLDVACFADPANAKANQPVTWTAEAKGGYEPYTYSWTGSDGLYGSQRTALKYYSTIGTKSAYISVTSADGRTVTKACSNDVKVTAAAKVAVKKAVAKVATVEAAIPANTANTASSMLSLANVPWGMVAIILIIMLLFTVIYLLFNRKKI